MDKFENVTIIKKANTYFDGKVTSYTISFQNGERKTLGIMMPGEYEFGTVDKEHMEILGGSLEILLPGTNSWQTITEGQAFEVPADSSFKVVAKELSNYCCSYIK